MKIAFISSEAIPYVKTGGLGDVCGPLPRILKKKGINIINFLPYYKQINKEKFDFVPIKDNFEISDYTESSSLLKHYNEETNLTTYFIKNDHFFNRDEIYNNYTDNPKRFVFFCKAVLKALILIKFKPDIIHVHDWQTSAIPILIKNKIYEPDFFRDTRTLLTIHNLAFQGIGKKEILLKLGLDAYYFVENKLEFYQKVNLLKGGILYADFINTVSKKYAQEIQTDELGFGLKEEIISRKERLFGILNGIDYEIWDPRVDTFIAKNYSFNTLEYKNLNKIELKKIIKLPSRQTPLIGMISRITSQKGFDLLLEIFDKIMELDLQLIILGTGEPNYHERLKKLADKYFEKFVVRLEFSDELAHLIEAGSDIFLMPSYFEPCGLNQMISLKYGTIPIVYKTGGLADTIKDIRINENGNGFVFKEYKSEKFYETIKEALSLYNDKEFWKNLIENAMKCDFSWDLSANKYYELYKRLLTLNGDS